MAAGVKIWLAQQAPQWLDTSPDSLTYQLHAQALVAPWQGFTVEAEVYNLNGFLALHDPEKLVLWHADSTLAYASVLGSHVWLYAAYLAVWQLITPGWTAWATYSNAAWAAFFPAVAFGFVRCLGGSTGIARFAAELALLDPSAGVNGDWLLKDTVAGWFALAALWATARLIQEPRWRMALILTVVVGMLGTVRFAAVAAILVAVAFILVVLLTRARWVAVAHLTGASVAAVWVFSFLQGIPLSSTRPVVQNPIMVLETIAEGEKQTWVAGLGNLTGIYPTVVRWRSRFQADPLKALATAVARTLFAPYPWVAFIYGIDYDNGIELYYPGVLFWMLCLPGILWALVLQMRQPSHEFQVIVVVLCVLLGVYVLFMGEWSTRQRVFMLPVFFSFAALGWVDLRLRWIQRWHRDKRDAESSLKRGFGI